MIQPGMMYFLSKWGAKEPQNPQNHRVVMDCIGINYLVGGFVYILYVHPETLGKNDPI